MSTPTTYANMRAFIVTPFGVKKDAKGHEIDFDHVRTTLIEPALDKLGIGGKTTGEIVKAGSIHADMFKLLLVADLVVAEVSIHNANVFYELGIRHALRQHRTFMLRGADKKGEKNDSPPFDIQGLRYLKYDRDDPAASLDDLVKALRETLDAPEQDSPVFRNLPALKEQERSHFQPVPPKFTEEVEVAQLAEHRGDLAMLALETRGHEWWAGGLRVVGRAQLKLQDFVGARRTWEDILEAYPNDMEANLWLGTIYHRLCENSNNEEMLIRSDQVLKYVSEHPEATPTEKAEAYALQGRNAKTRWVREWRKHPAQRRERALRSSYLATAYEAYSNGFKEDLNHYYSGLNALAMLSVRIKLAKELPQVWAADFTNEKKAARELDDLEETLAALSPSVEFSIRASISRRKPEALNRDDINWPAISHADYCFLTSTNPELVNSQYNKSLAGVDAFSRDSVGRQIRLYEELGLFPENVAAALEVIGPPEEEKEQEEQPRIILFTGHRVDEKGRKAKRFPPDKEDVARAEVRKVVEAELKKANGKAIGIAGGASGGDILFHEVCVELNIPTHLYLAFPREDYIRESVQSAGEEWVERFNQIYTKANNKRVLAQSKDLPAWLQQKTKYTIWQRNNLWTLSNALALDKGGGPNVVLIALWDKQEGDGPGGTKDMVEQALNHGARTKILWTKELFGL
jgi:hypothetical protein